MKSRYKIFNRTYCSNVRVVQRCCRLRYDVEWGRFEV